MLGAGDALKKLDSRSACVQPFTTGGDAVLNVGCRKECELSENWAANAVSAAFAPSVKNESPVVSAVVGVSVPFTLTNCCSWPLMSSGVSTSRETLTCGIGMSWPSQFVGVKWPYAPSVAIAFCAAVA